MLKAGEILNQNRTNQNLSLEEVSKATKIRRSFLEAIEKGEYNKLPSVSYAQGFVKNYAKFLGLAEKEIMPIFRREFDAEKNFRVLPRGFERQEEFPISKSKFRQSLTFVIIAVILFLSYMAFQYKSAFLPPTLIINSPTDKTEISSSQVEVTGKTDSNATVYIKENLVSVDEKGNFKKEISVFPGKSVIIIKAINKFSKETDRKIEIDVKGGS